MPSAVGMYFQYPLPSRMMESGSPELNVRAEERLPSVESRCPTVSPSPLTSIPKPIRVVYRNRCGSVSCVFGR